MDKKIYNIILVISIIALFFAFIVEYILGHQPCNLCLLERVPYALSILTIIFYSKKNLKKKNLSIILAIFFIIGAFLSIYHLGIEQGIFKESFVCSASDDLNLNKEQLLQQLQKMSISCKNVTFRIFGFSLTTYNLVLSIIISIYLLGLYAKQK
tara:strand:- start:136 stop:597 length:462 start_codon:yes stop_codon:yes gene_type:complete